MVDAGKKGSENQAVGLAEALDLPYQLFPIHIRRPWSWLPRRLWTQLRWILKGPALTGQDTPRVIIACGRASARVAALYKRAFPTTRVVQLLHPRCDLGPFDWVVVPRHDRLSGPQVLTTDGVLHRVTPQILAAAGDQFLPQFQHLPKPWVALIIGGPNKKFQMSVPEMSALCQQIHQAYAQNPFSLLITFSRRTPTPVRHAMTEALNSIPHYLWDDHSPNPYFGFLALADYLCVTMDSISMLSEACSTGNPVYGLPLKGNPGKFKIFYDTLTHRGCFRVFEGTLEDFTYEPLDDRQEICNHLLRDLGL